MPCLDAVGRPGRLREAAIQESALVRSGFLSDNSDYDFVYWNTQTSGVPIAGRNNAGSGRRLQDVSAINLGGDNSWDVGGSNDLGSK